MDRATRAPAQDYGIYPQKGTIAVGSMRDLAVVDLDLERVVRAEELQGMSDFSPSRAISCAAGRWPPSRATKSSRAMAKSSGSRPAATCCVRQNLPRRTSSGFAGRRDGHACGDGAGPAGAKSLWTEAISPLSICQVA